MGKLKKIEVNEWMGIILTETYEDEGTGERYTLVPGERRPDGQEWRFDESK